MPSCSIWQKASFFMVLVLIVVLSASSVTAEAKSRKHRTHHTKKHHALTVNRGNIYADIVIEAQTGRILHASHVSELRHPASLTKMMTLYLAFQAMEAGRLQLGQPLPVSARAAAQSPSKLGLKHGETIGVRDAVLGIVTESANDAAVVMAEALGGSEDNFANMMTHQARILGMTQTVFYNASGLPDPRQVTTARDMAILGHALIYHYPRYYSVFSRSNFTYEGRLCQNHNHLMERYEGMDGIKTGYIRASGFNLVASAERDGRRLIGVVFGGRSTLSRDNQMAQLLDQGFADERAESQAFQIEEADDAQGDTNDVADSHYIALPSKVAAVFPLKNRGDTSYGVPHEPEPESQPSVVVPSNWGIQVGAYSDAGTGQQMLAKMAHDLTPFLNQADPILQKTQTSNGTIIYRARYMGMEQPTARSICSYIIKQGQGCLVVAPERAGQS